MSAVIHVMINDDLYMDSPEFLCDLAGVSGHFVSLRAEAVARPRAQSTKPKAGAEA